MTVKAFVPSPKALFLPSLCFDTEIRFPRTWKYNATFHSSVFLFQGFVLVGFFGKSINLASMQGRFQDVPAVILLQEQLTYLELGTC